MRFLICVLGSVLLATSGFAVDGDGGYAGAWFQMPLGARPTALGGAYTAISDDGAAFMFNPAGLANLQKVLFSTSYRVMKLDRKMGYAMGVVPIRNEAVLGVSWLYSASGSVETRDDDGMALGETFSMTNHKFSVIFSKRFEDLFSAGVNLNYLYSRVPTMSSAGVGFDIGGMLYLSQLLDRDKREGFPVQDIQVGLTIKNVSAKYKWNSEPWQTAHSTDPTGYTQEDKVPVEVSLGTSARFFQRKLVVDIDGGKNNKQKPVFRSGAEYFVTPQFALRAGYGDKRFSAGTGYVFKFAKQVLAIDYAFASDRVGEGAEHIISLDLLF